jgi:hypothetical protein
MASRSVFISYSRSDRDDVDDAVGLLRAGGVKVFLDVVDIDYGERWKDALTQALKRCERVMVFWSRAAAASEWVEREWRFAIELGKKIVPTLLDMTPLPAELAEFQAIRRQRRPVVAQSEFQTHSHSLGYPDSHDTGRPSTSRRGGAGAVVAAAVLLGALAGGAYWMFAPTANPPPVVVRPSPAPVVPAPPPMPSSPAVSPGPVGPTLPSKPGPAAPPAAKPAPAPSEPPPDSTPLIVALVLSAGFVALWALRRRRAPPAAREFVAQVFAA